MQSLMKRTLAAAVLGTAVVAAPLVSARLDSDEPLQSYRQSYFALVAMNFGPITSMLKGEMPWDQEQLEGFASDLEAVSQLNLLRGFAPGSDKGTTRAKPEIWENMDDFKSKFADFQSAVAGLADAVESGDKQAIGAAAREAGGTCKACHDEYKSKDYLY